MTFGKFAILFLACAGAALAQGLPAPSGRDAINAANLAERDREARLFGITDMKPGLTAYDIGKPGNANYDEALANPYPKLPELMTFNNGKPVRTAADWKKRRLEIRELFDREVYGRYPKSIPKVTWRVDSVEAMDVTGIPAIVKHVTGQVDNSAWPTINVTIKLDVVTPAATRGHKVPVIIGGGSVRPRPSFPPPPPGAPVHKLAQPDNPPDSAHLLLEKGWGFVWRNSTDVQADSAAGLTRGIIGLVNKGQPRKLDDWGVLRAWAWTDSRALDYLQTDPDVDGRKVGVMGHSRGGKAALVAMADDPRFATAYVSSPGAGGANLFRRNYGEGTSNLTGSSEFDWYAGNFLKYGAVGHSANELPVDAHEFIALIAPRPVFIGGGVLITDPDYAPGDAWQDARGMFMASVAAGPAWDILGRKGLGTTQMPPVGTALVSGDIGWRQHEWGHTPAPNWPAFIAFAARYLD